MNENLIVSLKDIVVEFDGQKVLDGLSLDIHDKEFVTFLGPSGCGKTTTLRVIAGFVTPKSGNVFFDGKDIANMPPYKRPVNTVFQKYALFPHLTVRKNVEFALDKTKRTFFGRPSPAARKSVEALLERFEVGHLAERYPREIPGARGSASHWPAPLSPRPGCCCWTNPLPRWIRSSGSGCAARSAPCSTNGTSPSC